MQYELKNINSNQGVISPACICGNSCTIGCSYSCTGPCEGSCGGVCSSGCSSSCHNSSICNNFSG